MVAVLGVHRMVPQAEVPQAEVLLAGVLQAEAPQVLEQPVAVPPEPRLQALAHLMPLDTGHKLVRNLHFPLHNLDMLSHKSPYLQTQRVPHY